MDAATRIARATSWWEKLSPADKPDLSDVETCARLDVRDRRSLERLVLQDTRALGRHFPALGRAIEVGESAPQPDFVHDIGTDGEVRRGAGIEGPAPDHHAPGGSADGVDSGTRMDPRETRVRDYVESARAGTRWSPRLDDAWVARLLGDPAALADMPVNVARKHRTQLQELLGGASGREPMGTASAEMFSHEPLSFAAHHAQQPMEFEAGPGDGVRLRWPRVPDAAAWYKVYAGEGAQKPLLFEGRLVGEGPECETVEDVALTGGRRLYSVWVYAGKDAGAAAAAPPALWASGALIASVRHAHVTSDGGRVAATWTVEPGVERVEVHRIAAAAADWHVHVSDASRVGDDRPGAHLTGFEDPQLPPGEYVYRFYAVTTIDGVVHRSVPVERRVAVDVRVPSIEDLSLEVDEKSGRLNASWGALDGVQVELHCTDHELVPGARDHQLDQGGIERLGLGAETRVNSPAKATGGRDSVEWQWPEGYSRVHVIAVSVVEGVYRVGASRVHVRLGVVDHARVHERVHQQYLTFAWPAGASSVEVRHARRDDDDDPVSWPLLVDIDRRQYQREGGVRLRALPAEGTQLAVVGSAVEAGRQQWGPVTIVDYPGLRKVTYNFASRAAADAPSRSSWFRRERKADTTSRAQSMRVVCSPPASVELVLVTRPDRIPLHAGDTQDGRGQTLPLGRLGPDGTGTFDTETHEGWRRLFLVLPDDQQPLFAVLDPDVSQLRGESS